MPQMYPALWSVLYIYFMGALLLSAASVYFSKPVSATAGDCLVSPTVSTSWEW